MNTYYALIIAATLIGFCGLAWLLLAPIWRFLDREEKVSERWTKEALARRRRRQGNGQDAGPNPASPDASSDDPNKRKGKPNRPGDGDERPGPRDG
jgi:hypothetical protein